MLAVTESPCHPWAGRNTCGPPLPFEPSEQRYPNKVNRTPPGESTSQRVDAVFGHFGREIVLLVTIMTEAFRRETVGCSAPLAPVPMNSAGHEPRRGSGLNRGLSHSTVTATSRTLNKPPSSAVTRSRYVPA